MLGRLASLLGQPETHARRVDHAVRRHVPDPCWTGEPYQPVPVDDDASRRRSCSRSASTRRTTPASPSPPAPRPTTPAARWRRRCSATPARSTRPTRRPTRRWATPTRSDGPGSSSSTTAHCAASTASRHWRSRPAGDPIGTVSTVAPKAGDTLVTSIDASVQALAEKALSNEIAAVRAAGKPATSGALVVMDPNTGRIIAAASYPTYDPTVFVGGISAADYAKLTAPAANDPLVGRAIDGEYAPGSTFKLITASSDVTHGEITTTGKYPCPSPADGGRAGEDELRQRGVQLPADAQAGARRLVRHVLLRAGRERVLRRPGPRRRRQEAQRVPAGDGVGVRRRHPARGRPAGRRADDRQLRRPRDPPGRLGPEQGHLLRRSGVAGTRTWPTRPSGPT